MDDNFGEWVQSMGVASGRGYQEVDVASGSKVDTSIFENRRWKHRTDVKNTLFGVLILKERKNI